MATSPPRSRPHQPDRADRLDAYVHTDDSTQDREPTEADSPRTPEVRRLRTGLARYYDYLASNRGEDFPE